MTSPLEQRYRRLLRSYPRTYREERSEEIISTLLQLAHPGQRRPTIREAVALVLGGLRTRAGIHLRSATVIVWAGALNLAVLLLLADGAATMLAQSIRVVIGLIAGPHLPTVWEIGYPLTTVLVCVALPAAAAGRRAIALALTLLAILAQHWSPDVTTMNGIPLLNGLLWQLPLAAALTIPLLRRRVPAAPYAVRWLIAVPVALIIMPTQLPAIFSERSWTWGLFGYQFWILQAAPLGCLLWSLIDARVPIAAGAVLSAFALPVLLAWATNARHDPHWQHALAVNALIWGVTAALPLTTGVLRAARQARL
jgi:hypothetical protein